MQCDVCTVSGIAANAHQAKCGMQNQDGALHKNVCIALEYTQAASPLIQYECTSITVYCYHEKCAFCLMLLTVTKTTQYQMIG
jgi:hypothetical protein